MKCLRVLLLGLVVLGLAAVAQDANAQFTKRLKQRAKQKVEQKIGEKQDEAIDNAIDEATDGGDASSSSSGDGGSDSEPSGDSQPAGDSKAAKLKPGEGAWANYDFVPGDRIIFFDDFGQDRVGNFPQRMEFRSGNMQIVEWNGQRWLSAEEGELFINLPETLPERFTMEFELAGDGNPMAINLTNDHAFADKHIELGEHYARLRSGDINAEGDFRAQTSEAPVKIRISFDGSYVKLYANEVRALNVPNANLGRTNRIAINMNGWSAEDPRMIANVRIAAGGTPMYDALVAEGRFATQGILFETGSDLIQPESTPTLREIGDMLKQHADLRLRIEGHTDNVGDDASNQSLSDRRAAAVKAFLVDTYKIDASRLESQGFGETQPAASNDTSEGRQQNRRVELVKL